MYLPSQHCPIYRNQRDEAFPFPASGCYTHLCRLLRHCHLPHQCRACSLQPCKVLDIGTYEYLTKNSVLSKFYICSYHGKCCLSLTVTISICHFKGGFFQRTIIILKDLLETYISLGIASFSTVSSGLTDAILSENIQ